MSPDKPRKISIVTEKSKNLICIPVTGAYGASSPDQSSFIAHFFIEHNTIPSITDVELDDKGRADPNKGKHTSRGDVTREIQATLMMSPESAIVIGKWLSDNGSKMISARNQRK